MSTSLPCYEIVGQLQNITVKLDNTNYTIPPTGYVEDTTDGKKCQVMVGTGGPSGTWVLGDTFIRNFYVSLNY